MKQMLDHLTSDLSTKTFIDLGSGKGRAVFMAAEKDFKKLIGVEFSTELHDIALKNLVRYRKVTGVRAEIEFINQDVICYNFPKTDLVIFLYNPFHGRVMKSILKRLENFIETTNLSVTLLYRNPQCASKLEDSRFFSRTIDTPSYRIYQGRHPH
jgi:predicted RNA methylase